MGESYVIYQLCVGSRVLGDAIGADLFRGGTIGTDLFWNLQMRDRVQRITLG